MQATLIYNPNSGSAGRVTSDELLEALLRAGYYPVYKATSSEQDLDAILSSHRGGLVVVAGGDGTVRAVATRLIRKKTPIAILPLGTANNISKTLGIRGEPWEIIAGLSEPRKCYFDVGHVLSPWGEDYFLEAFGFGLYAELLAEYEPEKGKSILRSISTATKVMSDFTAPECKITLDGKTIPGKFLMVEALNTTAFGPRLKVAPDADPSDGVFELVRIDEQNRDSVLAYLAGLVAEEFDELPSVDVSCGKRLEITWDGSHVHVDAEVRPETVDKPRGLSPAGGVRPAVSSNPNRRGKIRVKLLHKAIEFWLPK
ncbi:MAG: diacylglycerol kinase family lipid kinase [Chloroflexota bacterium]|nr:MAG: diacylglycerol kinase family lipid kinase [Chloroflexota bacterium]